MRKLLLAISIALLAVSCQKFDDSKLWETIRDHESRISLLEQKCSEMNTNIASMQAVLEAVANRDYISGIHPIVKDGATVGYTIIFRNSDPVTIYNGKDGKDGTTPQLSIAQGSDGEWYWKLNGEWLLDGNGAKVRANGKDGITPRFKIEDGSWYVSYDSGKNWAKVAPAVSDPLFSDVKVGDDAVTFVLSDGTEFSILRLSAADFNIPSGIVMLTKSCEDLIKTDTLQIDIRVNPSDFPLTKEHISLMCMTHTYSVADLKDIDALPFDPEAKSNYEVVALNPLQGIEGGYRIDIAVNGKGNYFEDTGMYVLAGAEDAEGKLRTVCSSSPCDVSVIPTLEDGLVLDCPEQSFYNADISTGKLTGPKKFIIGAWANIYKDDQGSVKVYDRTKLGGVALCDSLAKSATISSDYLKEYGLMEITIDSSNEFWASEIDRFEAGEIVSTELEGMTLRMARGYEQRELPIKFKVIYRSLVAFNETMTKAEATALRKKTYDIDAALTECGIGPAGYVATDFFYSTVANVNNGLMFNIKDRVLTVTYGLLTYKHDSFGISFQSYFMSAQRSDGTFYLREQIPSEISTLLLNVRTSINTTITDAS